MDLGDNQRETGLKVPGLSVPDIDLSGCDSDGLIHMEENRSLYTRCYNDFYRRYPDETYMHWQIQPWRQNETLDLVCRERDSCTRHPEVRAMMFIVFFSDLRIPNVERAMFNSSTITCSVSTNGSDISANASCLIDVTCEYVVVVQRVTSIVIIHISQ